MLILPIYATNTLKYHIMKTLIKLNRGLVLVLVTLLTFESCTSKREPNNLEENLSVKTQAESQSNSSLENWKINQSFNDSIGIELYKQHPNALNVDTIQDSYTLFFQDLLGKSSNLIFVKEAFIKDVRRHNGNFIITVYSYSPEMVINLYLNSQMAKELTSKLEINDTYLSCCLIAFIKEIIPVNTDLVAKIDDFSYVPEDNNVSDEDIRDYVHIGFNSSFSPVYFVKGDLVDFYFLK
jgi:hypothetical protein